MTAILKGACQFKCVTQDFLPKVSCMLYYETILMLQRNHGVGVSGRQRASLAGSLTDLANPTHWVHTNFHFTDFFVNRERPRSLNFSHPKGRNSQRAFISFSMEKFVIEAFCLKIFSALQTHVLIIKIMHDVSIEMPS